MGDKITFHHLVEAIAEASGESEQFSHDYIKEMAEAIKQGLEEDGEVRIANFGKFELRWMDERPGYNPQTGEEITIPAHSKVAFTPFKELEERVNEPFSHLESRLLDKEYEGVKDQEITKPVTETEIIETTPEQTPWARWAAVASIAIILLISLMYLSGIGTGDPAATDQDEPPAIAEQQQEELNETANAPEEAAAPQENVNNQPDQPKAEPDNQKQMAKATPQQPEMDESKRSYRTHTVARGDVLWDLADRTYDDPYLWPWIYDENNERITDPDQLAVGAELQIPLPQQPGLTSRDSALVADAYVATYKAYRAEDKSTARLYLWAAKQYDEAVFKDYEDIHSEDLAYVEGLR